MSSSVAIFDNMLNVLFRALQRELQQRYHKLLVMMQTQSDKHRY
jgi:hypothetical protein